MTSSNDAPANLRPITLLAAANLAAQAAEQLSLAAVPIVAVMLLQAGPGEIGLLASVQTLPFLLLAMPLGMAADKVSRKRLMMGAELLRALSLFGLLAVVLAGQLSIAALAVLGFIDAVGTVAFSVAAPALLPALLPPFVARAQLARANGRLELARSAAYAAGPALGGALVAWTGAAPAFVIAAVLSLAAAALLAQLVEPQRPAAPRRHPLHELAEGARGVWQHALLRPVLLCAVAWNLSWFVMQAAYVPYAMRVLGLSASAVGLTLACYGIGMVCGALLAPRILAWLPFGRAILLGPAVSVLAMSTMVATLFAPHGALAALSFFFFGVGPIIWTISSTTLRQTVTPAALLGRVGAIFLTVNAGARPIGAALGGAVGAAFGEAACLWLALAGFCVQAAIIFGSPMRRLERLPAAAG